MCAAIHAFNALIALAAFKVGPCLAAGNKMIIKASEKSPLSTMYLGKLSNEAGITHDVFNIINGAGKTGILLSSHPGIDKISFTGSVNTGKKIAQATSGSNSKRVALDLGGKSPSIIFSDANLEVAVKWCI